MGDITVSIAEFKANLSRMLAESRAFGKTIILLNKKKRERPSPRLICR